MSDMIAACTSLFFSAYLYADDDAAGYQNEDAPWEWPWHSAWWRPKNPRRDLVRAAALIAAEIDRIDRAALAHKGAQDQEEKG